MDKLIDVLKLDVIYWYTLLIERINTVSDTLRYKKRVPNSLVF